MQKIWKIKQQNQTKEISKEIMEIAGNKILANLLLQRGLDTPQKIKNFLNPSKMKISSPFVFTEMKKSVERIFEAIEKQEKIIIYGDFDADGVTSSSLLFKTLSHLKANVEYYIPNREHENHGLNTKALVKLIAKNKAKLIITVDCGVSDVEQVNFANGFKVDVIITDHHEAPEELPKAFSILNPKAMNSLEKDLSVEEIEFLNQLAGVGVAFKLACGLLETVKDFDFIDELLPLVAVGTIADVVPLLGENRAFVDLGLNLIAKGKNPGLRVLLEKGGCEIKNGVSAENIAFGVAPRINAAGRLDTVDNAVKLLVSKNLTEIEMCAEELNNLNRIRQDLCDNIHQEALVMLQNEEPTDSIILYNPAWHIGIIGIVASKLVEKFYKPVFLMTKDENTGFIRCSSRGIPDVHIRDAISDNEGLFVHFGGHAQAAGLVFDPSKVSFDEVKAALSSSISAQLDGKELCPTVEADMELDSNEISLDLIDSIRRLEPFGEGNRTPIFVAKNLTLNSFRTMGSNNNHLKVFCENTSGKPFECVYWNHSELNIPQGKTFDTVFCPKTNTFNGITTIQLDVQDIKSDFMVKNEIEPENVDFKFYDHRKKTNIYPQISDYLLTTKVSTDVFAQNKLICDNLKPHSPIYEKICTKKSVQNASQLMFFDYPSSEAEMRMLLKKSGAKILHFMSYDNKIVEVQDLIKNISGMLKYVCNNKGGEVCLTDVSAFLSISDEVAELCFDIFESMEMIQVLEKNKENYKIKFVNSIEFSKIKENDLFEELQKELQKIYDYRQKLCVLPLEEVICLS